MIQPPSPKQQLAIKYLSDKHTNFIGFGGAAFGGKSYLICTWITHMALAYPDTGWGLVRRELTTLKKTTLRTLFKVFMEMNIREGRDYSFNGQLNVFTFKNGSDIFLIDTAYKPSDPLYTRFGGYELTGCAIDESAESPSEAVNILFTRCGRRNNKKYGLIAKMLEGFNPVKNHVYNRYYSPWKKGILKNTYAFIPSLPTDNPSPEVELYIKNILENSDRVTIERLIHGNFEYDDDPSILIDYSSMINSFTNTHVQAGKKYISADIAMHGSDLLVIYAWAGWQIVDIKILQKSNAKDIEQSIRHLAEKHGVGQSNIIYDADGIGAFLKGYLNNAVSFNNGGKPLNEEGKSVMYKNIKSQCYFKLADIINSNQLFINAKVAETIFNGKFVREIISEQSAAIRKENKALDKLAVISKDVMKELIGCSPDFMDAMMMRAYFDLKPSAYRPAKVNIGRLW